MLIVLSFGRFNYKLENDKIFKIEVDIFKSIIKIKLLLF